MIGKALTLVRAWLLIDFFGETRRTGQPGSSLTSAIFTQSFVALIVAALLFDTTIGLVAFAAANLSLSTLLIGVGALSDPQSTERRAADRVLIGTAPVSRGLLPLARTMRGAFHLGLLTIGTALPPAILCGFVAKGAPWVVPTYLACAVLLAGVLTGALSLAVRVIELWFGPLRAALVAGTAKAGLLGGALIAFALCLPRLDATADALPGGREAALAWPPYWAARFLAHPLADVGFGIALVVFGVALFGIAIALGDPESRHAGGRIRSSDRGPLGRLERHLARSGPLLGVTTWTSTMLFRSPGFRARVLPLFGIPLAMVLLAFAERSSNERTLLLGVTLQLPAIYLPFLVAFLPHADHEGAGWLFATSPHESVRLGHEAALIALSIRILLPVQAIAAVAMAGLGFGALLSLALPAFSWALSVLVGALAVRRLEHVPFTANSDEPPALEFGGLIGVALVLATAGGAFAMLAGSLPGLALGLATAVVAYLHLRRAPARTALRTT